MTTTAINGALPIRADASYKISTWLGLLTLGLSFASIAQQPLECNRQTACEFQVYIENDSIGSGSDRYYTNGIKLGGGVSAEPVIERLLKMPAERVLQSITDNRGNLQFGLFFGQNLYTPKRIAVAGPQPLDRPWAAWLYLGGVAQNVEGNRLQTVELDLGLIGPAALGKPVQTTWHQLVDADRPQGWNNQLRNEPGLLLAYMEKLRYGSVSGVQAVPHFGITIGNVMTLARAGGIVRLGHNMSGFGPDTIEPGGAMLQRSRQIDEGSERSAPEWYVFLGVDGRLVARNIFLDGNSFRESASVDRRTFVHDFKAGVSVRITPLRISVTHVRRSAEFFTSLGSGGIQQFQSFNVSWEF